MAVKAFTLPDVGEGVAEGELLTWLVAVGQTVTEDQPVAEVETDKSIVEIPSPYNGTVKELLVDEGTVVPVGEELISFEVDEETVETDDQAETATDRETDMTGAAESEAAGSESAEEYATPEGRVFAPPRVRRLARELGVDIAEVSGSEQGGRISEQDVREATESEPESEDTETPGPKPFTPSGKSAVSKSGESVSGAGLAGDGETAESTATTAPDSPEAATRDRTAAAPATRKLADELGVDINAIPTDVERDGKPFVSQADVRASAERQKAAQEAKVAAVSTEPEAPVGEPTVSEVDTAGTRIPYRGVRRTIGEQMGRSTETIPHVSHHDTATVSQLVSLRSELKPLAEDHGARLTYLPFVMKAIVRALTEMPILNSRLDEGTEEIILQDEYHIGMAVATDAGLLVPVVRNVDEKTILELAEEIVDLAERARDRKLSREEMQGGTFTITNFGAIRGEYATPIINHPETAILGLGAIEKRPVVEESADGDEVVARETLPLSLSIDHRVIDGAEGAEFANRVIEYLENPNRLLLEST
jgi:pyruvate dehydrogenase E2 component (dihydrolipoamide acetyltransferase)